MIELVYEMKQNKLWNNNSNEMVHDREDNKKHLISHLGKSNYVVTLTEFTHFLHLLDEESTS